MVDEGTFWRIRRPRGPVVGFLCISLGFFSMSCGCVSRERAMQEQALLRSQNVARSDLQMRSVAASIGAELLPVRAGVVYLRHCQATVPPEFRMSGAGCLTSESPDGKAFRFVDADGKKKLAIRVVEQSLRYVRLARRGRTFIILSPAVWRRVIGKKTECECDAGPHVILDGQYFVFVTDDVADFEVRELVVDVREDFVDWECKVRLVRLEEPPRPSLGFAPHERPVLAASRAMTCASPPSLRKF